MPAIAGYNFATLLMPVYHLHIDVEFDFRLVGITCHEKDYRLAWSLNRLLGWNLERQEDLVLTNSEVAKFALYTFRPEDENALYTLLSNKSAGELWLPELPHYDYLLKMEDIQEEPDDILYRKLRSIPMVVAAFPVIVDKLRMKQNLLWN